VLYIVDDIMRECLALPDTLISRRRVARKLRRTSNDAANLA